MKRYAWWLAVVTAGLILIGSSVLWVRSHYVVDFLQLETGDDPWSVHIVSNHGTVSMAWAGLKMHSIPSWRTHDSVQRRISFVNPEHVWDWGPFGFDDRYDFGAIGLRGGQASVSGYSVIFPHWFLVLLAALIMSGLMCMPWMRRRSRRRMKLCVACGYDLRGSPGGTCPECGAG